MHKRRNAQSIIAALAICLGSAIAFAHNGVEHVMGTITAMTANSITVDTPKHTSTTVLVDASTKYSHNGAEASMKHLKVGDRVVIDAKENAEKKLVGVTVKWGASAAGKADHTDHSK